MYNKCGDCKETFLTSIKLQKHKVDVHGEKKIFHKCSLCSKEFSSESLLQRHKYVIHEGLMIIGQISKITCSICKAEFTTKQSRDKHVSAVHEKKKPYLCPHCGLRQGRLQIWRVW